MQGHNAEHHQDTKHKEIHNKENVPQTYTTTGYIILGLCKLNVSRTTIIEYGNHVENPKTAARPILGKKTKESIMACLKTIHWLPTKQKIGCKICTLIQKCHKGKVPSYLQNLLQEKKKIKNPGLRSEKHSQTQENTLLPADYSPSMVQTCGTHYQSEL